MSIYCTYLTTYRGNKLPPFYIGSTSIDKINRGYHGSVRSKQYREIWEEELKMNNHLFKTIIISTHNTRIEALDKEAFLQKSLNSSNNLMYINKSIARRGFDELSHRNANSAAGVNAAFGDGHVTWQNSKKFNKAVWNSIPAGTQQSVDDFRYAMSQFEP